MGKSLFELFNTIRDVKFTEVPAHSCPKLHHL